MTQQHDHTTQSEAVQKVNARNRVMIAIAMVFGIICAVGAFTKASWAGGFAMWGGILIGLTWGVVGIIGWLQTRNG